MKLNTRIQTNNRLNYYRKVLIQPKIQLNNTRPSQRFTQNHGSGVTLGKKGPSGGRKQQKVDSLLKNSSFGIITFRICAIEQFLV